MDQPPQNPIAYFAGISGGGAVDSHPEPLTPEQLSQITHARARYKKVNRAISVASADAWTTAIFAGISLLGSAMDRSIPGILLGLGMAAVSYNSFRGLKAIRDLNPGGAVLLAKNQLFLGGLLFLYAGWNILMIMTGKFDLGISGSTADELNDAGYGSIVSYLPYMYYALYGGLIAFAVIGQSCTAFYYSTRTKYIEEYVSRTAEWVLQIQKMGFKL
jgi:hypothetical protein